MMRDSKGTRGRSVAVAALALVGAAGIWANSAQAREQVPAEERIQPFTGLLPSCSDGAVLSHIQRWFASRETSYWQSTLTIDGFDKVGIVAERPWGSDYVPRRFCTARALMSDGHVRRVDYFIKEDLGIIGMSWGVNWCVHGLDRNYAYAPDCKMARP
jgi:hypothetical protein